MLRKNKKVPRRIPAGTAQDANRQARVAVAGANQGVQHSSKADAVRPHRVDHAGVLGTALAQPYQREDDHENDSGEDKGDDGVHDWRLKADQPVLSRIYANANASDAGNDARCDILFRFMPSSRLAIVGTGPVARTLGRVLRQSPEAPHLIPQLVVGRSHASAADAAAFMLGDQASAVTASAHLSDVRGAGALMLAVPDGSIAALASQLAELGVIEPGMLVFHCAGALDASLLAPCAALGALTASVHPLTSFADPAALSQHFAGVFCITEGNALALEQLEPVFAATGARIARLSGSVKAAYHAGAVLASGYLVTTVAAALAAEQMAGIDAATATAMLAPLIRVSIDNALKLGPKAAMTGPLPRGDDAVVRQHYAIFRKLDPALADCYAALTRYAAHVLQRDDPLERRDS